MNVQRYLPAYLEYCEFRKELDKKTLKAYRIDLRQYFGSVGGELPKKQELDKYITELHKCYKQKTVKRKLASVKAFYNFLEEEELIEVSPFRRVKVKFKGSFILPRIIPRNEIETLLNYLYQYSARGEERFWLRDIAIVEMLFASGARVYEVSNIKKECVDLCAGTIRIMGKGGKERYIQIGEPDVVNLLRRYYEANAAEIEANDYFFINNRGHRFSEQSIRLMIKKYAREAGIGSQITPHMFRHSFATYLIEEGVDVSCVQQMLGHSSIRTTQVYIHIAAGKQAELLRELHPRKKMKINSGIFV